MVQFQAQHWECHATDNQVIPDLGFPLTKGASSILGLKLLSSLLDRLNKFERYD